jgi:acyl-CoA synthetase (NDP forming)
VSDPVSRARAFALDDGRTVVPEPDVKAALAALGVSVPRAVGDANAAPGSAPVVLKAFGPGIVHKSELGAVRIGVAPDELAGAVEGMKARLAEHAITPAGFLVEEQSDTGAGLEVIVGVVRREPFGLVIALGLGGTLTELLDLVAVRMFPLHEHDARELVATFPAGPPPVVPAPEAATGAVLVDEAGVDGDEHDHHESGPALHVPVKRRGSRKR